MLLSVSMADRRSVTWTALTIVLRGLTVGSVKTIENVAVTDWTLLIASVHVVAAPRHAPPQPLKLAWLPGVAVRVTIVPAA